jgi:group I intron endonuclease
MKLNRKRDLNRTGIYLIRNTVNNKFYIGKAICIYNRMLTHIAGLNKKSKDENSHLIRAWHLYGRKAFEYIVLEYLELDEKLLSERELFWQTKYDVTNPDKGYNFRLDSSTGMICHPETRKKMRETHLKRFLDPIERKKCSHDFWKRNPEALKEMSEKVRLLNIKYYIDQYDKKTKVFVKRWDSILDLMKIHPEYKKHNIYAVCSGEKPSMYGFIWKKVLKS